MDPTPRPDIPDPASATPATPAPVGGSAAGASSSVPRPPRPREARLPGTYAANYDGEVNWQRGVTMLWVLFGFVAVGEVLHAAFILLANRTPLDNDFGKLFMFHRVGGIENRGLYPSVLDCVRVGVEAVLFLTLWLGWNWTRWLLVLANFLSGVGFILWSIVESSANQHVVVPKGMVAPSHVLSAVPGVWLGIVYVVGAGYLALSKNVTSFIQHRREEGRGWVVAPLAVIAVGGAVVLLLGTPAIYFGWLDAQQAPAEQFAKESMQAMAAHWDPAVFAARGDADYLKVWTEDQRKGTFATLTQFGALQSMGDAKATVASTSLDPDGMRFVVEVHYDVPHATFEHGHGHFNLLARRHLFEPWRLGTLGVDDTEFTPTEAPAEMPAPVAAVPPAVTTASTPAVPTPTVPPAQP